MKALQFSLFDPIQIPLNLGFVTIVDSVDADLSQAKWNVRRRTKGQKTEYVKMYRRTTKSQYMHRVIMSRILGRPLLKSELVDHINGNGLDNRRANLRLANKSQNVQNVGIKRSNTSGYKGVSFHKRRKKWDARISVSGHQHCLGTFDTPEEAHKAYCDAAKRYHGEFARLS